MQKPKINLKLAKERNIPKHHIEAIKVVYELIYNCCNHPQTYENPAEALGAFETTLQVLWGFAPDKNYHSFWNRLEGCTCPELDNVESFGSHRVINGDCPHHGSIKND